RRGNARLLEDHFYPFWQLVMDNLVYDEAYLITAPQMTLWNGAYEERRPDFIVMGIEACNRSIGFPSAPDPKYPDFPAELGKWNNMRLVTYTPHLLGEAKRPPSRRHYDPVEFREQLMLQFFKASNDLNRQALLAFREWWSFRIFDRSEVPFVTAKLEAESRTDSEEEDQEEIVIDEEDDSTLDDFRDNFLRRIPKVQRIKQNILDCRPERGRYTSPLLFGSPASNQHFYYVLKFLRQKVAHLEDPFAKPPPPPPDVDEISDIKGPFYIPAADPGPSQPLSRESRKRRDKALAEAAARRSKEVHQVEDDGDDPLLLLHGSSVPDN
ncbi:hypothetical protein C0992_005780, partial [Termitomyces sp. T32_za158]